MPAYLLSFSPSVCLSVCLSPFLICEATPQCGCTFKCIQIPERKKKRGLVRSNSLELWGFLLNYAICFFQSKRPSGPAFNIFTHVLQREEEMQRKKRGWWWSEGKSVKTIIVFLYLPGPNTLIRWEEGAKSFKDEHSFLCSVQLTKLSIETQSSFCSKKITSLETDC